MIKLVRNCQSKTTQNSRDGKLSAESDFALRIFGQPYWSEFKLTDLVWNER